MWNDPIVEETRRLGDEIAARFNYDVEALGRYFQSQQTKEKRVFVKRLPKKEEVRSEKVGTAED